MAQINLLSTEKTKKQMPWQTVGQYLIWVLSAGLLVCIGVYAFLYFSIKNIDTKIFKTQNEIKDKSATLADSPKRKEVITRQGQLQVYANVLNRQPKWTTFLAQRLAPVTLKKARYVLIDAQDTGEMRLSVNVPGYADLDKFLQIFDDPNLNKVFTGIKVGSVAKSQAGDVLDLRFDVNMSFKPEAIKSLSKEE